MSEKLNEAAKSAYRKTVEEYELVKHYTNGDEDRSVHKFLYEQEPLVDPETGEEVYFEEGYGHEVRTQIIVRLGHDHEGELRAVLNIDPDNDIKECQLQHKGRGESWQICPPENAVQEDALEWFLTDALSVQDYVTI